MLSLVTCVFTVYMPVPQVVHVYLHCGAIGSVYLLCKGEHLLLIISCGIPLFVHPPQNRLWLTSTNQTAHC